VVLSCLLGLTAVQADRKKVGGDFRQDRNFLSAEKGLGVQVEHSRPGWTGL